MASFDKLNPDRAPGTDTTDRITNRSYAGPRSNQNSSLIDHTDEDESTTARIGDQPGLPDRERTGISRSLDAGERDYDSLFSSSRRGSEYDDEDSIGRSYNLKTETAYRSGDRIEQEGLHRDCNSDQGVNSRANDTSRYSRENPNDRYARTGRNGTYDEGRRYSATDKNESQVYGSEGGHTTGTPTQR